MTKIDQTTDLSIDSLGRFDEIIDVRSPGEFAEDHIPGAVNLPVLDNEERAEIGRIYVQESRFRARRIGAALVSKNIARHLETSLRDKPAEYRSLIYCWRGGMRSNAMATVFSAIGWRTDVVGGGYKTWRRAVVAALSDEKSDFKVLLIDGQTGSAKTEILNHAADFGAQVLDLEALAAHRGSVFGGLQDRAQPAQRLFESLMWQEIARFDPARPILIEAESSRVGQCFIPARLWRSMRAAPRVEIRAGAGVRARHLVATYGDMIANPDTLVTAVERLRDYHPKSSLEDWRGMIEAGDFETLARCLIEDHYDAVYDRTRKRRTDAPLHSFTLEDLETRTLRDTARRIADLAGSL